jgi:hypothetical protein
MLHGLAAECLHAMLREAKRRYLAAERATAAAD